MCTENFHTKAEFVCKVLEEAGCAPDHTWIMSTKKHLPVVFDKSRHIGLIILGGDRGHADQTDKYKTQMSWIRTALERGSAVLGICFGAQLLAQVDGPNLVRGCKCGPYKMADQGLTLLTLNEKEVAKDPLLRHIKSQTKVLQWHEDTFEAPRRAVELASSTNRDRPHCEAFRIGINAYGLQFHPDMQAPTVREWVGKDEPEDVLRVVEETGHRVLLAWAELARDGHNI